MQLSSPADLDSAWRPGVHALQVVDHNCDARIRLQVAPFLRTTHSMTSHLDCVTVSIEAKAHRHDVWGAIARNGCDPSQPLPTQILDLLFSEIAHPDLLESPPPANQRASHQITRPLAPDIPTAPSQRSHPNYRAMACSTWPEAARPPPKAEISLHRTLRNRYSARDP